MSTIISSPFKSEFGFSSPNFSVDALGNVIARSIIQSEGTANDAPVDFEVTESTGGASFYIAPSTLNNPPIEVFRSSTYVFSLDLSVQVFNLYLEDQSTLYTAGIKHSDGSIGVDALSKQEGKISWLIPVNAPDVLYYGNQSTGDFGLITVGDAIGQFSTVNITEDISSTSATTGSLTVVGGAGITENLNVGETITANELSSSLITSASTLELSSTGNLSIRINNTVTGTIGVSGSTVPVINTTINDTVIGDVTPSSATFVTASITELPTTNNNITNKLYVDSTATALAIAFGI
jgi:hypothetical protein